MLRIDVRGSRELQATILSIRRAPTEIKKRIRQHTKDIAATEWTKALAERAETRLEHALLVNTARVQVSDQNIKLKSGSLTKKLSGGLPVSEGAPIAEFGTNTQAKKTYQRKSKKGGFHSVTRRTRRAFKPINNKGYVVYPAAGEMIPRIASLWVQTTIRTFYEALERK